MNDNKKQREEFGKEVRKKLIEIGMTQKDLALAVGASERYIWHITHGRRKGTKYLTKIIKILCMD